MFKIRPYKPEDYKTVQDFLVKLQDFLIPLDPEKLITRHPKYKKEYTENLLRKIEKHSGKILIAETTDKKNNLKKPVGFIAGIVRKASKKDKLEVIPFKKGKILELYIEPDFRGKNLAPSLINNIQKYFQKKHCQRMDIEVFAYNLRARRFYEKCGFKERMIKIMKKI